MKKLKYPEVPVFGFDPKRFKCEQVTRADGTVEIRCQRRDDESKIGKLFATYSDGKYGIK